MALHLNLYHEIQKQQRARKRDPLKLGMYGLAFVVLGFVAYYFVRLAQVSEVSHELGQIESEWQKIEPKKIAAETREAELTASIKLTESLEKHIEGRFYWGPILEQVMNAVPHQVQITRLEASRTVDKPENYSLVVNGISTGPEPRQTAEDLRTALEEKLAAQGMKISTSFRQLEDSEEKVQFNGRALPTATFAIYLERAPLENAALANAKKESK